MSEYKSKMKEKEQEPEDGGILSNLVKTVKLGLKKQDNKEPRLLDDDELELKSKEDKIARRIA